MSLKTITSIEQISEGETCQVDLRLGEDTWETIGNFIERNIRHGLLRKGTEEPEVGAWTSLHVMFDKHFPLILKPGCQAILKYEGDSHGRCLNVEAKQFAEIVPLESVLIPKQRDIEALIAAFYLIYEMNKFFAFWHGLYDRDFGLVMTSSDKVDFEDSSHWKEELAGELIEGFLITKMPQGYRLRCLARGHFGKISYKVLEMKGTEFFSSEDVLEGGNRYFY